MFSFEGIELEFDKDAIDEIANIALERKTGARGLRSVIERLMLDLMYEIPSDDSIDRVTITRAMVLKQSDAVIKYSQKKEKSA